MMSTDPNERPSSTPPEAPPQRTRTHPSLPRLESTRERIDRHAEEAVGLARSHAGVLGREPDPGRTSDEGEGLRGRVAMLERRVGQPADPNLRTPASGLIGDTQELRTAIDALTVELRADRESRDALALAIRAVALWSAKIIGGALLLAALGWLLAHAARFHFG
jgi:hypothetical protein